MKIAYDLEEEFVSPDVIETGAKHQEAIPPENLTPFKLKSNKLALILVGIIAFNKPRVGTAIFLTDHRTF